MTFSNEQIRMLAEAERKMDAGETPWVRLGNERVMVSALVMEELGLEQGQTITDEIFRAILRANIAALEIEIAARNATSS
jgi:hypothetical protein